MFKRWAFLVMALWAWAPGLYASPLQFQASGLGGAGSQAVFALNFVDGDGASNQLSAGSFISDGTLGLQSTQGNVSGSLASGLIFDDSAFFNEALIGLTGAGGFAFTFDASSVAPAGGSFADSFSVFAIDALSGLSLVETDDPTGANALLLWVIDGTGGGALQVYRQVSTTLPLSWLVKPADDGGGNVPEPATWTLVAAALTGLWLLRSAKRRGWRLRVSALAASLLLATGWARAEDLTGAVQITRSGLVFNRITNTFDSQVTVTNKSADTLLGPLRLVLESVAPVNVALYNSAGRQPSGADYTLLPLNDGSLAPGASTVGTVRLLTYGQAVTASAFSVQGQRLTAATTAQLQVSVVYAAGLAGPQETPVGAGFNIQVDGNVRGSTDAAGKLIVKVALGSQVVAATKAPSEGGSQILPALTAGTTAPVKVVVEDGKEIAAGSALRFDQVQQGVLARNASRITLRFLKDERAVRLTSLNDVSLIDVVGNYRNVSSLFSVQADGAIAAAPAAFFQATAASSGKLRLEVSGEDATGAVHTASVPFFLADYRVRVQLVAPPSTPGLSLAGITLVMTVLNTDLRFVAQADSTGYVTLPDVPAGNLSLAGSTAVAGIVYNGTGTAAINKNSLVQLTMRGPQDMLKSVPPISVLHLRVGSRLPAPGAWRLASVRFKSVRFNSMRRVHCFAGFQPVHRAAIRATAFAGGGHVDEDVGVVAPQRHLRVGAESDARAEQVGCGEFDNGFGFGHVKASIPLCAVRCALCAVRRP